MELPIEIFKRISENDIQAYELLFKQYYKFLCSYAFGLTREKHIAEEIVEDFFLDLWKNRDKIKITTSVRSYFISAVHKRCINYLQREKPRMLLVDDLATYMAKEGTSGDYQLKLDPPGLLINELENLLKLAIDKLPQGCKEIFTMSRKYNMSYEEIADKLNISINTVKSQIKIALQKLREDLKDYLVVILFFILK